MAAKDDPRIKTGELVGNTKGVAVMKNKDGETIRTNIDDPRIKSGLLVGVTAGSTQTEESNNKRRNSLVGINKSVKLDKCSFCKIETIMTNLNRWHNEKCKYKSEKDPEMTRREDESAKKIKINNKPLAQCFSCENYFPLQSISKYHNEKCWVVTGEIQFSETVKATDRNYIVARDTRSGDVFQVSKKDFVSNDDLVYVSKGLLIVKDKNGKKYKVDKTDPRLVSGELKSVNDDLIIVEDSKGLVFEVKKDCPKLISGQLKGKASS